MEGQGKEVSQTCSMLLFYSPHIIGLKHVNIDILVFGVFPSYCFPFLFISVFLLIYLFPFFTGFGLFDGIWQHTGWTQIQVRAIEIREKMIKEGDNRRQERINKKR